jgi:type VII secretion protein EccB
VPHGSPVGLSGAPQSVPGAASLVTGPWLACLAGSVSGAQDAGVGINFDPAAPGLPLPTDKFVLVSSGGADYVIWRNHKLKIGDPTVAVALGVTNADPIPAPSGWLDQLPSGDDLVTPAIPGAGQDGPKVAGRIRPVGQLFAQSGTDQLFVLRRNGLAAVDQTAFMLLQGISGAPIELDAADVASAPRSDDKSLTSLLPAFGSAKWQDPAGMVLCERQAPVSAQAVSSSVVLTDRANAAVTSTGAALVAVKPGTGAIVYPIPLPSSTSTPVPYLITDEGISYQMADADTLSALKFSSDAMVPFPKQLLSSIRSGPALSRKAIDLTEGGLTS